MFGLFKKTIDNEEQLDLIFNILIDLRTSFRRDDRQYDSALLDIPKWVNSKCDALNMKMTSGQRAYVDLVGVACRSNVEKIRRNVDQILAILDTIDPHATPDMTNLKTFNQKAQLQTLRNEIENIFMAAMKSGSPH